MGINSSKQVSSENTTGDSSSSPSDERLTKLKCQGSRVFLPSCLRNASQSPSRRHSKNIFLCKKKLDRTDLILGKIDNSRRIMPEHSEEISRVSSTVELDVCPPTRATSRCLTSPNHLLSRFSFIPGNFSSKISRPSSSARINVVDEELRTRTSAVVNEDDGALQSNGSHSTSQPNLTTRQLHQESSAGVHCFTESPKTLDLTQQNATTSSGSDSNRYSPGNSSVIFLGAQSLSGTAASSTRSYERTVGGREPVDRNVRFSRTLSVGRLRDRVLRRSPVDFSFRPFEREREVPTDGYGCGVRPMNDSEVVDSERDPLTSSSRLHHSPSMPVSSFSVHNHDLETSRSREARYHNLMEHRSNFVERRRRIRSQVRALQRIGSRFENFSGHERSCILSGQHRTGHCSCRLTTRDANNDGTSARTSISRIVMLAEALFEVLDEIHQQSVVLSTRNSGSSIGSVPAPVDVVESLPLKTFWKSKKSQNDEAAQCYICLGDYEDGDRMRVLPCHHEFHRVCVDKWLKEIHRICPLCRGDVCRSDSFVPRANE